MAYWIVYYTVGPLLRLLFKVKVEGIENVPADGAVIMASNHVSFSDSIFLPLVLKRRITFVAKAEYFDDWKTAWFFRAIGQIPIRREGGSASQRALDSARDVLEGGGVFGIYPEGTRSPDGRLYKGHTGIARLALQTKTPIIPVAMIGTREAQPIGQVKPNFFSRIVVRFGKPLEYDYLGAQADDRMVLRSITDEVMYELRELSGQEYVNQYAKRRDTDDSVAAAPVNLLATA